MSSFGDDALITSPDPLHPANLIPSLCAAFYNLGWVTGTGGGLSIRTKLPSHGSHVQPSTPGDDSKPTPGTESEKSIVYLAPSGVQKERIQSKDIFVLEYHPGVQVADRKYLRKPAPPLTESQCTPLFWHAFDQRDANCCIHTHSQHAVMATLLADGDVWRLSHQVLRRFCILFNLTNFSVQEMIKGLLIGGVGPGTYSYLSTLELPIIKNTPREADLADSMAAAMRAYPNAPGILVRRHGVYVWGENSPSIDAGDQYTYCDTML